MLQSPPFEIADQGSGVPGERPPVRLLLAAPRGFCAGVRRAIDAVRQAIALHGPPIYVRRAIVHNLEVVRSLERDGAIFIDELDEAPQGSVVIFSAHGVAPRIADEARDRGLVAYDAVCPLVAKVHREVERHHRDGRSIVLVGHGGHPEIEGTLGHVPRGSAFLVNSVEEVRALPLKPDQRAAYAVQTTYSVGEAAAVVEALEARFEDLAAPASSDICYATTNRQAAVKAIAGRADAVIVAGESFSSNANRLAEVAAERCRSVQLVANAEELDWSGLPPRGVIGISAAASTPESTVDQIIEALGGRYTLAMEEVEVARETAIFKPVRIGRSAA